MANKMCKTMVFTSTTSTSASRFREARELAGMSQTEAATRIGVPQPTLSRWETGKSDPNATHLVALCKLYRRSADELLGLTSFRRKR